ncbi:hypothetical protein B0H65DRAFT_164042 [Neurospora tetraspora]|uniref:Uncharacterized protein n=1 Tax=Neurospora tetraspora TaxID=94610 RepID=A0AAE0JHP3_9PEZI|nr:hypothetical protein B0H65DRAFT_164042 [Neurospora tetraspora]
MAISDPRTMSSPLKKQHEIEVVADRVLKRVEISRMVRRLQNRLALAQFKTKHGLEDLTLDSIEPRFEKELRRSRLPDGDILSDSSSSASDLPYPTRGLMSSPLKAPVFSDAIGSSNGSSGHRKRSYLASFEYDQNMSSPSKRFRQSPTAHRSFTYGSHPSWKDHHDLAQSSPMKPQRQRHFTTSTGPNVALFDTSRQMSNVLASPGYGANPSDDEDDPPVHSFARSHVRVSPPRTPPMRTRNVLGGRKKENKPPLPTIRKPLGTNTSMGGQQTQEKTNEEGADLLLYLAASPSPARPTKRRFDSNNHVTHNHHLLMEPPSTPPPKHLGLLSSNRLALPSSMMTTPGGGNPFPNTPGLGFDFSDFVHMTPSPAQKPWKTPIAKTPLSVSRRRLTFDE